LPFSVIDFLASSPFYQNGIEYEATKTVKRFLVNPDTGKVIREVCSSKFFFF
jgi:hypothetical protein